MVTRIGDRNLFMLGTHVGHDCQVGSDTVFANNATLAGHVTIGDFAVSRRALAPSSNSAGSASTP